LVEIFDNALRESLAEVSVERIGKCGKTRRLVSGDGDVFSEFFSDIGEHYWDSLPRAKAGWGREAAPRLGLKHLICPLNIFY
jgi:hypothetical protein